MAQCFREMGGEVASGTSVRDIEENDHNVSLATSNGVYTTRYLLVCAGLMADRLASLHVCNAPSPAATSAIPIGGHICDRILERRH